MALKVGELFATLTLQTQSFNAGVQKSQAQLAGLVNQVSGLSGLGGGQIGGLASSLADIGGAGPVAAAGIGAVAAAAAAGVAALGAAGAAAVKAAGEYEQTELAFTTMLGSAEAAQDFLQKLSKFAAETPFDMPGLQQSSRLLMAYGFQAQEVIPTLTAIGDAVAGMGGGSAQIDRAVVAFGQMSAKTKVASQEMMQLTELGIPAWELLAKAMNKSVAEVMDMVSRGQVSAKEGIDAITKGMNQKFGGMMEKQSKTFFGVISNLKDSIGIIFRNIGKLILPFVQPIVQAFQWAADIASQAFDKVRKPLEEVIKSAKEIGRAFLSAFDPLMKNFDIGQGAVKFAEVIGKAFGETAKILREVAQFIRFISKLFSTLYSIMITFVQMLVASLKLIPGLALAAAILSNAMSTANDQKHDDNKRKLKEFKEAAEAEAKAVLDVVQANREARVEEEKRKAALTGFGSLRELWEKSMTAVTKAGMTPGPLAPLTPGNLPETDELRKIQAELKRQTEQNAQLIKITQQRLGTYV